MSKLDELIQEYCPDGVEICSISEICRKVVSGGTPKSGHFEYYGGSIPWLRTQEVDWNDVYDTEMKITEKGLENSAAKWIPINCVIVAMYGATAGKVAINKVPLTTNQACCNLEIDENRALYRYVFYWLNKEYDSLKSLGQGSQSNINAQIIKQYPIPVPPLPVQEEIVRILDSFTELTAELQAELQARKKQYDYYRDELLHLDGEIVTIEDLFDTRNGFTPSKDNAEYWNDGTLPWFKVDDIKNKGRVLYDSYMHITPKALKKSGLFPENSIIISTSATIGEYALITVPFLCNQRFTCMTLKPHYKDRVNIKYLMHYCPMLSKYCKEHLNHGNFASVDMKQFVKFEFVIPSLEEQKRIVSILDRFDSLCNDLTSGLPAEIEARQKQYEYYRDKLLTFKPLP